MKEWKDMRHQTAKEMALGGILAALAVVIMCLGGLIPIATFVCPMLCMLCMHIVVRICGNRVSWAWYLAVSALCLLLSPDKEAAAVFLILGYYPILKPAIDRSRLRLLWKFALFNSAVAFLYTVLLRIMGIEVASEEYWELGWIGLAIMLILGNVTFFFLDVVLTRTSCRKWK